MGTEIILGFALLINRPLFSGKTCMLYYILLLRIIRAQPILFQDMGGQVSHINREVMDKFSARMIPGEDILALVDADQVGEPHMRLFRDNIRVLLSWPRPRQDQKWLTQCIGDEDALFLVKPWSRKEFLVAMLVYIRLN